MQGSIFHIEDLPALLFETDKRVIFVCEINRQNRLNSIFEKLKREEAPNGIPYSFFFLLLRQDNSGDIITMEVSEVTEAKQIVKLGIEPFFVETSFPRGSGEPLGWSKKQIEKPQTATINKLANYLDNTLKVPK